LTEHNNDAGNGTGRFDRITEQDTGGGVFDGRLIEWFQDPMFWMAIVSLAVLLAGAFLAVWWIVKVWRAPTKTWLIRWNVGPGAVIKKVNPAKGAVRYKNQDGDEVVAQLREGTGRQTTTGWAYVVDDRTGISLDIPLPGTDRPMDYGDGRDVAAAEEDAYVQALNSTQPQGFAAILKDYVGVIVIVGFVSVLAMLGTVLYILTGNGGVA
jgi:hypothetical protein